jgi:hypothetical protein
MFPAHSKKDSDERLKEIMSSKGKIRPQRAESGSNLLILEELATPI